MLTTTQLIPEPLDRWSKNRGNLAFARQSPGKTADVWGKASSGRIARWELISTYVQRNRLCKSVRGLLLLGVTVNLSRIRRRRDRCRNSQ